METLLIELTLLAFITSFITGVVGIAGGLILIVVLPWYLSPSAIVPVHTWVQWVSNVSRAFLLFDHIQWNFFREYALGAIVGVLIFGGLYVFIPVSEFDWLPAFIGLYILLTLWWEGLKEVFSRYDSFYWVAAVQTGLGLFVGPTGPLASSITYRRISCVSQFIATLAAFMMLGHTLKLSFFFMIGFSFSEYLPLLLSMSLAAIVGTYTGKRFQNTFPHEALLKGIKLIISILALLMIFRYLNGKGFIA